MRIVRLLVVAWLGLIVPIGNALAATPEVRDQAGFFGADAVQKANRALEEIRRQSGMELLIETYAEPPAAIAERLVRESRDQVYADWAQERARQAGVNGIYVLITRNPAHLQVGVGSETRRVAFTNQDRDRLRDLLLSAFRQRRYDEGLLEAVDFTRRTLELNLAGSRSPGQRPAVPAPGPAPAREQAPGGVGGFSWGTILLWGGIILVGLWVLSRVLQSRAAAARGPVGPEYGPGTGYGAGQPGYGPGYGPQYGGGGFGRGILGGLLGGGRPGAGGPVAPGRPRRLPEQRGGFRGRAG
jgi:uncharacterized membrane protein YgcG